MRKIPYISFNLQKVKLNVFCFLGSKIQKSFVFHASSTSCALAPLSLLLILGFIFKVITFSFFLFHLKNIKIKLPSTLFLRCFCIVSKLNRIESSKNWHTIIILIIGAHVKRLDIWLWWIWILPAVQNIEYHSQYNLGYLLNLWVVKVFLKCKISISANHGIWCVFD